jgi:hypothetical protein
LTFCLQGFFKLSENRLRSSIVRICGEERSDGVWESWLEFHLECGLLHPLIAPVAGVAVANPLFWETRDSRVLWGFFTAEKLFADDALTHASVFDSERLPNYIGVYW